MQRAHRARNFVLICAVTIGAVVPVIAQTQSEPERIVRATASRILTLINQNLEKYQTQAAVFYTVVEDILAPHFDFELMSKLVLGKDVWRKTDTSLRNEFVSQFRNLLVRTYGAVLLKYRGEEIFYLKPQVLDEHGRVERVRMRVKHPDGRDDNFVDYVLAKRPQGWRVVDVLIDGVSIVTTYSATFQDSIRRRGMRSLITDLRKLNETAR
jgi:phospholipid transport system substrate-binding protein